MHIHTIFRGKLFVLLILLIAANINIFPQIKINEKVEIKPLTKAVMSANYATSANLKIEFTGDGGHYGITLGGHTYSCTGGGVIEIPDVPGGTYYEAGWGFDDDQTHCYSYKWYYNGFVIGGFEGCNKGGFGYGHINICDDPVNWWTFLRDFDIVSLSVVPQLDHNICEGGTVWDPTSQVTMSLGNNNAEFYNYQTKQLAGNSLSYIYNEGSLSSYTVVSKLPYDALPESVALTASLEGIVKNDIWTIYPQSKFVINLDNFDQYKLVDFSLIPYPGGGGGWDKYSDLYDAHLKVIQGGEYVSFFSYISFTSMGDDITIQPGDIDYYILQLDNNALPDTSVPVIVEYELFGNIQTDTAYINPPPLHVELSPSTIAPGDTADVIIKEVNPDGRLSNFPESQTYEVAVIDGCGLGNILVGDSLSNYFYDVPNNSIPIKFVADSSADSGTVILRVGLVDNTIFGAKSVKKSPQKAKQNKIDDDARIKKITKKIKSLTIPEEDKDKLLQNLTSSTSPGGGDNFCFGGYMSSNEFKDAIAIIGDKCSNISDEHTDITYRVVERNEYYPISVNDKESSLQISELATVCKGYSAQVYPCDDPKLEREGGASQPIIYKRYKYDYGNNTFVNSWKLSPYRIEDKVHYYFVSPQNNYPTPLIFDFITGVCYLEINPPACLPNTLIENINDVDNSNLIPSEDAKQAFADFCGHNCYPQEIYKYELIEIIRIHEREHMADYDSVIAKMFPDLKYKIDNFNEKCEYYSENAKLNDEKVIYGWIYNFVVSAIKEWQNISGGSDKTVTLTHEKGIQGRLSIKNKIQEYIDKLKRRFPQELFGKNCSNCSH